MSVLCVLTLDGGLPEVVAALQPCSEPVRRGCRQPCVLKWASAGDGAQNKFELQALRCRPKLMHSLYTALNEAAPSCGQSEEDKWRPILVRPSGPCP